MKLIWQYVKVTLGFLIEKKTGYENYPLSGVTSLTLGALIFLSYC